MEHAQHALHTANARDHIVQCTVAANNVAHMGSAKFVQDIHSNLLVRDILLVQYVEHTISASTVMGIPMDLAQHVDVPHLIHIIATVQTSTK